MAANFLLVLTLMLGGHAQTFVVDHGLTAEDCAHEVAANPRAPLQCVPERKP